MAVELYFTSSGGGGGGGSSAPVDDVRGSATAVPPQAETTVVSRTVPGGFTMHLYGVVATGNAAGEWIVYEGATERFRFRTSPEDRGKPFTFPNPLKFPTGTVCALKVTHTETDTLLGSTSRSFHATLLYRDA